MLINIPEDVAERLEQLAHQEGRSIGDLLETLLNRYAPESPPGSLAEMAQNAREAGLASHQPVDTANHSREILKTDYADYLKRRMKRGSGADHNG
jgi:Ribbon-helix-helix protein, copG family